jgi:hypothetical protein
MGFILLNGPMAPISEAQQPKAPSMGPFSQPHLQGACRKDPSIAFTEDQSSELETLQSAFFVEVKPMWTELRDLRLEMRYAVSESKIQTQVLFEKQMKMSTIQGKLENLRFAYVIKARSIFSKEQLERFPADCPLQMELGYYGKKGHGKGTSKRNSPIGR